MSSLLRVLISVNSVPPWFVHLPLACSLLLRRQFELQVRHRSGNRNGLRQIDRFERTARGLIASGWDIGHLIASRGDAGLAFPGFIRRSDGRERESPVRSNLGGNHEFGDSRLGGESHGSARHGLSTALNHTFDSMQFRERRLV